MFVFQRSVSPEKPSTPWSARQTQVWSIRTSSLLTSSAMSALPTCGPPTRKYTSDSVVGSKRWRFFELPWWPPLADLQEHGRLLVPASIVIPATTTPGTSATVIGTAPRTAVSVAWPMPSTTVPARLTAMVRAMS